MPAVRDLGGLADLHGARYSLALEGIDPRPADVAVTASLGLLADTWVKPVGVALRGLQSAATVVRVGSVEAVIDSLELADMVPAADLAPPGPLDAELVDLRFRTATTFASGDRRDRAAADPALMVGSWAAAWNGRSSDVDGSLPSPASETGRRCPPAVVEELGRLLEPIDGNLR